MIGIGVNLTLTIVVPDNSPGPQITGSGSVSPGSYLVGTEETITPGTAAATGGGTVTNAYQWTVAGIEVATTAAYTPVEADAGKAILGIWIPTETGGTNAGTTPQTVASGIVASSVVWIMAGGVWNDAGVWDDSAQWKDSV